jgi:hypothetical protein
LGVLSQNALFYDRVKFLGGLLIQVWLYLAYKTWRGSIKAQYKGGDWIRWDYEITMWINSLKWIVCNFGCTIPECIILWQGEIFVISLLKSFNSSCRTSNQKEENYKINLICEMDVLISNNSDSPDKPTIITSKSFGIINNCRQFI